MQIRMTEYHVPDPESGPYGIAVCANGRIWFTEQRETGSVCSQSLEILPNIRFRRRAQAPRLLLPGLAVSYGLRSIKRGKSENDASRGNN